MELSYAFASNGRCILRTKPRGVAHATILPYDQQQMFNYVDLVDFDAGVQLALAAFTDMMVVNPDAPKIVDREALQLEFLYIEAGDDYNKRMLAPYEVKGRRELGQRVCGGKWYMEVGINGTSTDCGFTTIQELATLTQQIMQREQGVARRRNGYKLG